MTALSSLSTTSPQGGKADGNSHQESEANRDDIMKYSSYGDNEDMECS